MSRHISWIRIRHRQFKDWSMRSFPRNEMRNCHHKELVQWLVTRIPHHQILSGLMLCFRELCTALCSLSARKEMCSLSGIRPGLLLCIVAPWKTSVVLSFPLFLEKFKPSCLEAHSRARHSNYPISVKLPVAMNPGPYPFLTLSMSIYLLQNNTKAV